MKINDSFSNLSSCNHAIEEVYVNLNVIDKGLFDKIDNLGFINKNAEERPPLVYVLDLTRIRFERR